MSGCTSSCCSKSKCCLKASTCSSSFARRGRAARWSSRGPRSSAADPYSASPGCQKCRGSWIAPNLVHLRWQPPSLIGTSFRSRGSPSKTRASGTSRWTRPRCGATGWTWRSFWGSRRGLTYGGHLFHLWATVTFSKLDGQPKVWCGEGSSSSQKGSSRSSTRKFAGRPGLSTLGCGAWSGRQWFRLYSKPNLVGVRPSAWLRPTCLSSF